MLRLLNIEKLQELTLLSSTAVNDVIFISETWFSEDSFTFIPNYKLFRRDRDSFAGGVAIYIHEKHNIIVVADEDLVSLHAELIWVKVQVNKNLSLLIGCCYRPFTSTSLTNTELIRAIQCAKILFDEKKISVLILAGDFNLPYSRWHDDGFMKVSGA